MKKLIARVLSGFLMAGACAAAGLDNFKDAMLAPAPKAEAGKGGLTVTFVGVATLLFDDGDTAIMTDGYFSRPTQSELRAVAPDKEAITTALKRLGVTTLAAVIPVHSHFDHALDSPLVAMQTGALLVGSSSTANVGRGYGLPEERIRTVKFGDSLNFGRFKVTFIQSAHLPTGYATGAITSPLTVPAAATAFGQGDAYSLLIEHDGKRILVQGSAGFVTGALQGRAADVVYLGTGGLGAKDAAYQTAYWREIVRTVGARRVIPIHWDNFFRPLDDGLVPGPDFPRMIESLRERGKTDGVDLRLSPQWVTTDPFAGLR
jgi:L-ascorbate metabolism protein UlaG (beta-lactamase superfamily)